MAFFGQIAGEPIATRPRFINKDELGAFRLHLTNKWIDVTLSRTDSAKGDNLSVGFLGDVGNGNRLFMNI